MAETTASSTRKIKAIEARHVTYCESRGEPKDLHVVKEIIHYDDNTTETNLRKIWGYQRPYYITKKGRRNHTEFKEWEDIDALDRYECMQRDLPWRIAKNLGIYSQRPMLRELCQTHFVYGADIKSTSHIKQMYRTKWPDFVTPATNAVFDTETDMVRDPKTGRIIMATISFKDKCYTAVQSWFLEGHLNAVERIEEITQAKLGEIVIDKNKGITVKDRKIKFEIELVPNEYEVVKRTIDKAHEWGPDFLSVWNIKFDMNKILAMCERENVDPAKLMCDPSIPEGSRFFKFKLGKANKKMVSGRMHVFKPSQQWHTVIHTPAKFQWVDAMCAYRQIRTGNPEEPKYSLDYMLYKFLKITKMKFPELEAAGVPEVVNARWHEIMQRDFPLHYVAYNRFDCISMELLDEKILDMQFQLPLFSATTDLENFNSQPLKIVNELSWFVEKHGKIMGSTGSDMVHENDEEVISGNGLIVMLPSHLVVDNGLKIIEENPHQSTNIRIWTADLDVSAAYPTNGQVFNVSKETTSKELIAIEGVDEHTKRMMTINFSGGRTNAVEFCTTLYKLPTLHQLVAEWDKQHTPAAAVQKEQEFA